MAELTPKERLQPSLLDRLRDDQPDEDKEPRSRRVFSLKQLRRVVQRDLSWLFNAGHLESVTDLEDYPEVQSSVLNYGVTDLTGTSVSGLQAADLERLIRDSIIRFEPRILAHTVRVTAEVDRDKMSSASVSFVIEGQLWAQPVPIQLYLSSNLDLDTGHVAIRER